MDKYTEPLEAARVEEQQSSTDPVLIEVFTALFEKGETAEWLEYHPNDVRSIKTFPTCAKLTGKKEVHRRATYLMYPISLGDNR